MCGISGFIDWSSNSDEKVLRKMTDTLSYRGPDGAGYQIFKEGSFVVGMGHRRLAIIDLSSAGCQPMQYHHLWIIFNGEVYNYREIKKELEGKGYSFNTHSDTEVILAGFMEWGKDVVNRLNGMFAFFIYDSLNRKCYCYRDRAGVKPFYFYYKEGLFLFGSELKALKQHPRFKRELDFNALGFYLQYGYIAAPHTIYKNTHKLKPGFYLELDCQSGELKEECYWDLWDSFNNEKLLLPEEDVFERIEELLISSFQYRMVADVPVGVFLSGGYDSTAVAAILQRNNTEKLRTFTIGFNEDQFNEANYAAQVASHLGTDHTEYYCSINDAQDVIPSLPLYYDEPFADSSAIPTIMVSRIAARHVKVVLSADGGDELFAGYTKYQGLLKYVNKLNHHNRGVKKLLGTAMAMGSPFTRLATNGTQRFTHNYEVLKDALLTDRMDTPYLLQYSSQHINQNGLKKLLLKEHVSPHTDYDNYSSLSDRNDPLNKLLAVDYKTYLPDDILVKVDRATMSTSIEGREPLLDYRLAEFIARLPSDIKYRDGIKKYALKKIVDKYVPEKIMSRPKKGFGVPVLDWCRKDLKGLFESYLGSLIIRKEGIFDSNRIEKLKRAYYNGQNEPFNLLWNIFIFEMWHSE